MKLFVRLNRGIVDHFPVRATEWVMAWPAFGMWAALQAQPDMFGTSPSFSTLAEWAAEGTWAAFVIACSLARLFALSINGTFKEAFPYTPHLRVIASLMGIAFWSQFTLGFISSYLYADGAASPVVAYSTFCLLELLNIFRSWSDVGAQIKSKRLEGA